MENKDLPAFPVKLKDGERFDGMGSLDGVSKLEFFACNAPVDIPAWFVHTPPRMEVTPQPNWQDIKAPEDQDIIKCWLTDDNTEIPDHLKWIIKQYDQYIKDDQAFRLANLQAKYFQWRRYYAEQLLITLSKP